MDPRVRKIRNEASSCPRIAYPEQRLPSGGPKEECSRMILEKNLPWGTTLKFSRQLLQEVRRGAGMCDDSCILDY